MPGTPIPIIKYLPLPISPEGLPQTPTTLPRFRDADFLSPLSTFIDSQPPNQKRPRLRRNYKPKELRKKPLTWAINGIQFCYP